MTIRDTETPTPDADPANSDLSWQYKGWPAAEGSPDLRTVDEQGWNVLHDDFQFPVMVVKERAVRHNLEVMSRFCDETGMSIAPHGKTTMSPELTWLQLEAGSWGVTAATVSQTRIFRAFGVDRILVANQVVDPSAVRWVWRELQDHPEFEFFCLVDSVAAVEVMERALDGELEGRRIDVLVELGMHGGRTGCRTVEGATAIARRVAESRRLRLAGIEGYEGILHYQGDDFTEVDRFLSAVRALTEQVAAEGLFEGLDEVVVSAGGSMFPDRVALILGGTWDIGRPVRTVIRSGGYVTHDSILYEVSGPFGSRAPAQGLPRLEPALFLWSYVLSRPEPGLALAGFGKRDVSFDVDLPVPLAVRRNGLTTSTEALTVFELNDQHAYIRLPADFSLDVGDMVMCGISHPCATFDRWRAMPVVDDDFNVVGAVRTFF